MKRWRIALLVLALAAAFFWRLVLAPDGFLYRPNSLYSDLTITHWPNALFIRQSLARWGQVPIWRPLILGGEPFAANPLSGLWYPPNLPLLVLPLTPAFNLLFILHTAWAGLGGYLLARSTGASRAGGMLAAFTLMFAPKAIAHLAAGHVGLYYAWAWLPWTLRAAWRLAERSGSGDVATAAVCAAMLVLADVRLGSYGGLAAAGYWLWMSVCRPRISESANQRMANGEWRMAHHVSRGAAAVLLAGTLVAAQMLPLAAVAGRLNRGGLGLADSAVFSLPPLYLVGLLVADHGGLHEWMTYVGVVGLALAIVGALRWRSRERWWWGGLALLAALYSLGAHTPFYGLLYRLLPLLRWLRGPSRAWFLVVLAASVLAARGLTALQEARFFRKSRLLSLFAAALLMAALCGFVGGIVLRLRANVLVAAGLWPLLGAVIALRMGGRLRERLFARLMCALALADLWIAGFTLFSVRPAQEVLAEGQPAAAWLAQQEPSFRVYSPSYSIPQQTGAVYGIESADGVDPFQLADYAAFMRTATGEQETGYSVTIPAFPQDTIKGDTLLALQGVTPDLRRLGLLNVRYVAAAYPMEADGLTPLGVLAGVYLYRNEHALPRTFVRSGGEMREARPVEWSPNRIVVEAEGPGMLVLSEVYDPDWRVVVDGQPAEIAPVEEILRGVDLGAGMHRVTFTYWPAGLTAGLALAAAGWVTAIALWTATLVKARKR